MKPMFQQLRSQLRISVDDVRIGMFIAELDRPWTETPFLMQGFLLEDLTHLQMLRDIVREASIDPRRSTAESLAHLPWDALHLTAEELVQASLPTAASIRPALPETRFVSTAVPGAKRSLVGTLWAALRSGAKPAAPLAGDGAAQQYYLRYADQPPDPLKKPVTPGATRAARVSALTPPSTRKFSQFILSLYPRELGTSIGFTDVIALWAERQRGRRTARKRALVPRRARDRADFLPAGMPLVVYHEQTTVAEETVRAKEIIQSADTVLVKMAIDIQSNLAVDIESLKPIVSVLVDSVIRNPAALMWSARMHDENRKTYLHGLKVAIYMMALGRHLGFPKEQLSELGSIGLLLDIGMLKIPASVLEKSGQLTADETQLLMQHVAYSLEALEQHAPLPRFVARGIHEHHERIDGSGYPQGLSGADISVYGRMAAIADTFAAMTTARVYDVTHSAFDAMKELFREAESKLHAPLVEQFVQAISIFPVGSLIELSTGEAAIVLEHNGVRRLEPKILVLTDGDKEFVAQPYVLELMTPTPNRKKILRGLADGAYGIDYRDYYLT